MRFVKYSHACVRIESDNDSVIVIDPGAFSERRALDGVDAVLITHEHFDHLDVEALADALAKRPLVRIFGNQAVTDKLAMLADVITTVESGDTFEAAGVPVRAYGGWHAEIYPEIPRVPNLGFLIADSLYHPGDSFDVPAGAVVDTVFVPISGPWLKLADSIDFIRAVGPRQAYALHDCLLSPDGLKITNANMARLAHCEYLRLDPGQAVELPQPG